MNTGTLGYTQSSAAEAEKSGWFIPSTRIYPTLDCLFVSRAPGKDGVLSAVSLQITIFIIDVATGSKFARVYKLKAKTDKEVLKAMDKLKILPTKMKSDNGTEFKNELVKDFFKQHNVTH